MSSQTIQTPSAGIWALMLLLSLVWGTAFMGMALALGGFAPLTVAGGRIAIGALAVLVIAALMGQGLGKVPGVSGWAYLFVMSLFNLAIPFSLLTWGLQHVPSAFAGMAMGASPLFVLVLAAVFLRDEQVNPRKVTGIVVGLAGLAILILPGSDFTGVDGLNGILGRIACIASSLSYAIGSVITRRGPSMPPLTITAGMLVLASMIMAPVALSVDGAPRPGLTLATLALVYIGLLPTGLAFYLRIRVIQTAGSVFMSLVAYIVPVWAVIFGIVLLEEKLHPSLYLALALIIAGVAITQWHGLRPLFGLSKARNIH